MFLCIVQTKRCMPKPADTHLVGITHKLHCVKYWLKIKKYPMNRIVRQAYECLFTLASKGNNNWVSAIRDLLCFNGFGIVWLTGEIGNKHLFFKQFKQTLIDNFYQDWNARMLKDENCHWYYGIKPLIETELYFSHIHFKPILRRILIKFRLGVSQINCHKYRFEKDVLMKNCPFCIQRLNEDENHVLFVCPLYKSSREEFLSHITVSFEQLQNCDYKLREFMSFHFYNIAKFLNKAMLLRKTVLKSRQ